MVRAADPSEQQYAQVALRLNSDPTQETLTAVKDGLVGMPGPNAEERFELLAMKADSRQAKLRARLTGH